MLWRLICLKAEVNSDTNKSHTDMEKGPEPDLENYV